MAWLWSFSVNVGTKEAAERFNEAFDKNSVMIDGQEHQLFVFEPYEFEGEWYVGFAPESNTKSDLLWKSGEASSAEQARQMTAVGNELFERLRRVSEPFVFAVVGVECSEWMTSQDIVTVIWDPAFMTDSGGLVVSQSVWEHSEQPKHFVPFYDGYYWIPWQGEKYPPK